jgi:hypothetical protein
MNFLKRVQKIAIDREEGKTFDIFGFPFKLRSFKSKHIQKVLLKNKIHNINSSLEDKNDDLMKIIIENIVLDWDGVEDDLGKVEFSKEKAVEILLDKDKKGEYKYEAFLWEMFAVCMRFDDINVERVFKASKNL